jgi:molybdate transport system substrate-binding protein
MNSEMFSLSLRSMIFPSAGRTAAALLCLLSLQAVAQELTVSAAASLTNAFQAVGQAFEKARPGTKIVLNFAASGPLLAQIRQGAPVDVFASADQDTMDRAEAAGLLAAGTRADFAANALVLIVPAGTAAVPRDLHALGDAAYKRVATGTPATVPAGRYTQQAVQQAGLAAALKDKWIYGENVRQVLNYVARGEVDAGFVYRTDALVEKDKVRVALTVPTATRVTYPIAAVAAGRKAALAGEFIAFVRGEQGQALLAQHGFGRP